MGHCIRKLKLMKGIPFYPVCKFRRGDADVLTVPDGRATISSPPATSPSTQTLRAAGHRVALAVWAACASRTVAGWGSGDSDRTKSLSSGGQQLSATARQVED